MQTVLIYQSFGMIYKPKNHLLIATASQFINRKIILYFYFRLSIMSEMEGELLVYRFFSRYLSTHSIERLPVMATRCETLNLCLLKCILSIPSLPSLVILPPFISGPSFSSSNITHNLLSKLLNNIRPTATSSSETIQLAHS